METESEMPMETDQTEKTDKGTSESEPMDSAGNELETKEPETKEQDTKDPETKQPETNQPELEENISKVTIVQETSVKETLFKDVVIPETSSPEPSVQEADKEIVEKKLDKVEAKEMETDEKGTDHMKEDEEGTHLMKEDEKQTDDQEASVTVGLSEEVSMDTQETTEVTATSEVVVPVAEQEPEVKETEMKDQQTEKMSESEVSKSKEFETKEAETKIIDPVDTASETTDSISTANEDEKENVSQESEYGDEKMKEEECYCGKERTLEGVELQCSGCLKWFHAGCLSINIGYCMSFMTAYSFTCRVCHPSNTEQFTKKTCNFSQLCVAALANLTHQQRKADKPKRMFSKDKELIPYINRHWEYLSAMSRRSTTTWHNSIVKAMSNQDLFISKEKPTLDDENEEDFPLFGLADDDLSKVGPSYEKQTLQGKNELGQKNGSLLTGSFNSGNLSSSGKGRSSKRKGGLESSQNLVSSKKTRSDLSASQKLPPHGYPMEHPYNKDGYRYILTESDPHSPATTFDHDQFIGKPIPAHLYRAALSTEVLLALHDRAPQLKISDERLSVTGEKGYSMVRATHGVNRGCWYYEVTIEEMPPETCTRIGWSLSLGNLQAPLGYDKFSYSWRSKKGTKFHCSRGKHYSEGYTSGDVLGFLIKLPDNLPPEKLLPPTCKDKALIKFKSHLYFEEKDPIQEVEQRLQKAEGSQIIFYKNGVSQGIAWEDVYEGTYYPAISTYKNAVVVANFGPHFKYPPTDVAEFEPIQNAASQSAVENTLADILYHVQNEDVYIEAQNLVAACS
ncbi:set1/Ash2 histone methyltransferase complex subunit ASH2-like isoform X2 [Anneissia japonica]|nr:set1/Ash2 histone methyltransferase complex subunit ASH2-like isoform X2 [Anneissia japonica]